MAKFVKKINDKKTKFDYENGTVEIRETTLNDERVARRNAQAIFGKGKKDYEVSQIEFLACLVKISCKFFNEDGTECFFKEQDILNMESTFLGELFSFSGSDISEQMENFGEE